MADTAPPVNAGPAAGAAARLAASTGTGAQRQEEGGSFLSSPVVKSMIQAFLVFQAVQIATKFFAAKPEEAGSVIPIIQEDGTTTTMAAPGTAQPTAGSQGAGTPAAAARPSQVQLVTVWPDNSLLDVYIQLSTAEDGRVDFSDSSLPHTSWSGVEYANSGWKNEWDTEVTLPTSVQNNGSLWADIFVTPSGISPDPDAASYAGDDEVLHVRKLLTRYYPLRKVRAVKNLLAGSKMTEEEEAAEAAEIEADKNAVVPWVSYWAKNLTVELVCNSGIIAHGMLPPVLQQHIHIARPESKTVKGEGYMFPITYANDFWLLKDQMTLINSTTIRLPLEVTFKPTSHWKWQLFGTLDDSFKQASLAGGGGEMDEVKRMLTDTNPILLITTVIVSALHMLFEFLAFTSDISHWKNKKELVGVSVRTILTNCFVQLVVLLYLMDNNENTSWMILFSQGTGLLIEAWKITKAVDIKLVPSPTTLIPYKFEVTDKHVLSEDELLTQKYDKLAFRYVSYVTIPTLVGYTIYSLYYNEHRSWYSFTISTLTSFVYAFGFVQLVPGLIINYKLKSVAHLPIKTFIYKFFATIVDDFFSFIIKMPLLHRLACFRDDVVFLILLYQMWIYKVDVNRQNEFGQKLTPEEAKKLLDAENKKEAVTKGGKIESKKDI